MIMWKHTKDGDFSTNSAYAWLNGSQQEESNFRGKWIWKIDMLPRVIHFLWLCMHESLPVRSVLAMRGIIRESCCPLCKNFPETISHLLKECVVAKNFWFKLRVPHDMVSSFAGLDWLEWLKVNCQSKILHFSSVPWSYVFSFAIWNLWKHRNSVVFNNSIVNENLHNVSKNQALEYFYCVGKTKCQKNMVICNVRWERPPLGWFKLNTDGAAFGNPGRAGGGGVIRDREGRWVKGFARSIGFTTSITAEFWALRDGLLLAVRMGVQKLVIELDAKVVVELMQSNSPSNAFYSSLLADCRLLLGKLQHFRVQHTFREANRVADAIAKLGGAMQDTFVVWDIPSSVVIANFVYFDTNGESVCRLVASNLAILA